MLGNRVCRFIRRVSGFINTKNGSITLTTLTRLVGQDIVESIS
jgi:hypothetical protein